MTDPERIRPIRIIEIQERIDPQLLDHLRFSIPTQQSAVEELIDNSLGAQDGESPLVVNVGYIEPKVFSISDWLGNGMNRVDLEERFFKWGVPPDTRGIHRFGLGGKSALESLAVGFRLVCCKKGEPVRYEIDVPDWEDRSSGLKTFEVKEIDQAPSFGQVSIELTGLKQKVKFEQLADYLGDTYRLAIKNHNVTIRIHDGKETYDVPYLDLESMLEGEALPFEFEFIGEERVTGWVGILAKEHEDLVKPGIRGCLFDRRKIADGLFFGHPTPNQHPGTGRLIGELSFDFTGVEPTINKDDFVRDTPEWELLSDQMHEVLKPIIAQLTTDQEPYRIPKGDADAIRNAHNIVRDTLRTMERPTRGIKPPRPAVGKEKKVPDEDKETKRRHRPRTLASKKSVGSRERLTKGGFVRFTCQHMGRNKDVRCRVEETSKGKVLIINDQFIGYTQARKLGHAALTSHVLHLAADELATEMVEERPMIDKSKAILYYRRFITKGRRAKIL